MNKNDPKFTLRLEPALRELSRDPATNISRLAGRHNVSAGDIQDWLTTFNNKSKLLRGVTIDSVKERIGAVSVTRVDPTSKPVSKSPPPAPVAPQLVGPTGDIARWLRDQGVEMGTVTTCSSYQLHITPTQAAAWLKLNKGNRNPSKAKVRRFAAAIKLGKWRLNGESIKFSATGRLLDGQSRLMAIVQAGVPAQLEVRGGLPDQVQATMDAGEMRKGSHTLEMLGEKNPMVVSPALLMLHKWETGCLSGNKFGVSTVLENLEIAPMLERHAGIKASAGWVVSAGYKIRNLMPGSAAAFFHYQFGRVSATRRDAFFAALADGIGLTKDSPAYLLREKLLAERMSSAKMSKASLLALVIKAWNAAYRKEKLSMLYYRGEGNTAEKFPEIAGLAVRPMAA